MNTDTKSIEHEWPRAHIVVDNFFAPSALKTIFRELSSLHGRMKSGLVRDIGHDGQSVFFEHERRRNKAVWIHDPSKTLKLFRDQLWSEAMLASFEQAREPLFQIIGKCWAPHLQVSSYMTGDHYDFHEDEGAGVNLTAIVFMAANPKKVRGGDLVLAYAGDEATIRFRPNRLVIFPSKTLHRVTPVRVASTDHNDARLSLQCWLTYGKPPTKPKARAAEADHPTFLLAEPSIVTVAQAVAATSGSPAMTPEDLYWGSFYASRILPQNLRCLVAAQDDLEIGSTRIRRGREALEIYGRGTLGDRPVRVGFLLSGPHADPAQALRLFVEMGRGRTKSMLQRGVPSGASEKKTGALLRQLLLQAAAT